MIQKVIISILAICATMIMVTTSKAIVKPRDVSGAYECDLSGNGTFVSMESEGCNSAPCNLTVDTSYLMGITFIAGESTSQVQYQVFLYYPNGGVQRLVDSEVAGLDLIAGMQYRGTSNVIVPARHAGVTGEISIMLVNNANGNRIVCGEFPYAAFPAGNITSSLVSSSSSSSIKVQQV